MKGQQNPSVICHDIESAISSAEMAFYSFQDPLTDKKRVERLFTLSMNRLRQIKENIRLQQPTPEHEKAEA